MFNYIKILLLLTSINKVYLLPIDDDFLYFLYKSIQAYRYCLLQINIEGAQFKYGHSLHFIQYIFVRQSTQLPVFLIITVVRLLRWFFCFYVVLNWKWIIALYPFPKHKFYLNWSNLILNQMNQMYEMVLITQLGKKIIL